MEIEYFMYSNDTDGKRKNKQVLAAGVNVFGNRFNIEVDEDGLHIRKAKK